MYNTFSTLTQITDVTEISKGKRVKEPLINTFVVNTPTIAHLKLYFSKPRLETFSLY